MNIRRFISNYPDGYVSFSPIMTPSPPTRTTTNAKNAEWPALTPHLMWACTIGVLVMKRGGT